jgi:hypothetical protein
LFLFYAFLYSHLFFQLYMSLENQVAMRVYLVLKRHHLSRHSGVSNQLTSGKHMLCTRYRTNIPQNEHMANFAQSVFCSTNFKNGRRGRVYKVHYKHEFFNVKYFMLLAHQKMLRYCRSYRLERNKCSIVSSSHTSNI